MPNTEQKSMPDEHVEEHRCVLCGGPNDMGELCATCAEGNDPFGTDLEAAGGWMVQDGR